MSSINGVDTGNFNKCMGVDVNSISNMNGFAISFGVKNALHFNSEYVDGVTLPLNFVTGARTIAFWVKPDVTTYNGQEREFLAAQYGGSGQRTFYIEFRETGVIRVYVPTTSTGNNSLNFESNAGQYFSNTQFYYITFTIEERGETKLYVDGVMQNNTVRNTLPLSREGANFNWGRFGSYLSTAGSNSTMKGLNVWRVERRANEVVEDMTRVYTGSEEGLYAYFPTTEGTGDTITDINSQFTGTITTNNTSSNYINDEMWVAS